MSRKPPRFRPIEEPRRRRHAPSGDPFYSSKRWRGLRSRFLAQNPVCAECERAGRKPPRPAREVHHVANRIENPSLSFSWENLEALCSECHGRITARERIARPAAPAEPLETSSPPTGRGKRSATLLAALLAALLAGCACEPCAELREREVRELRVLEAARCARLRAIAEQIDRARASGAPEYEIDERVRVLLAEESYVRSPDWRPR